MEFDDIISSNSTMLIPSDSFIKESAEENQ